MSSNKKTMLAESILQIEHMSANQLNEYWELVTNMAYNGSADARTIVESMNRIFENAFGTSNVDKELSTWITEQAAARIDEGVIDIWKAGRWVDKVFRGTKAADKIAGKGIKAAAKSFAKDGASAALSKVAVAGTGAAAVVGQRKKKPVKRRNNAESVQEGVFSGAVDVAKAAKWIGKKLFKQAVKKAPEVAKVVRKEPQLSKAATVAKDIGRERPYRNIPTTSSKFDGAVSDLPYPKKPAPRTKLPNFLKKDGPAKIHNKPMSAPTKAPKIQPNTKPVTAPRRIARPTSLKSKQANIDQQLGSDLLNVGVLGGGALVAAGLGTKKKTTTGTLPAGQSPKTSNRPKPRPIRKESVVTESILDSIENTGVTAKHQLYDLAKTAIELHKMINDTDEISPCVLEQIYSAVENIQEVLTLIRSEDAAAEEMVVDEDTELFDDFLDTSEYDITADDVLRYMVQRKVISSHMMHNEQLRRIAHDVAEFYSPMEELGTSDISNIIRMAVTDAGHAHIQLDGERARNYMSESRNSVDKDAREIYEKMTRRLRK